MIRLMSLHWQGNAVTGDIRQMGQRCLPVCIMRQFPPTPTKLNRVQMTDQELIPYPWSDMLWDGVRWGGDGDGRGVGEIVGRGGSCSMFLPL